MNGLIGSLILAVLVLCRVFTPGCASDPHGILRLRQKMDARCETRLKEQARLIEDELQTCREGAAAKAPEAASFAKWEEQCAERLQMQAQAHGEALRECREGRAVAPEITP